ncbi:MAG: hypothetical protein AAFY33_17680 [Cyanobacteria bacterium J06643_4]
MSGRRINKMCLECSKRTAAEAQELHGPQGNGCWKKGCHRIRSHYRHRQRLNEQRRLQYRQKKARLAAEQVETVALPVAEASMPYANLYIWREKRKDAPIHAIAATVFQDGSKVLEVAPIHCAGYRRRQIENYVKKGVLGYLNARYGITFFSEEIRLEPIECKISGCPYHDVLALREVGDG